VLLSGDEMVFAHGIAPRPRVSCGTAIEAAIYGDTPLSGIFAFQQKPAYLRGPPACGRALRAPELLTRSLLRHHEGGARRALVLRLRLRAKWRPYRM
jgi:hypothetical protein